MIPKIIHLCWLSGDPFPEDIQRCIDSWKAILPEYEVWLWGKLPVDRKCYEGLNIIEKQFNLDSVLWTKQAFEKATNIAIKSKFLYSFHMGKLLEVI